MDIVTEVEKAVQVPTQFSDETRQELIEQCFEAVQRYVNMYCNGSRGPYTDLAKIIACVIECRKRDVEYGDICHRYLTHID